MTFDARSTTPLPRPAPHLVTDQFRERCYTCYRPQAVCFCDTIPSIDNRTHVLILQHVKERFHAFNTARIVRQALRNCDLLVDQTKRLARAELPLHQSTGVLYPGVNAKLLSDLPASERPAQLIILDGTWHHAKTFMRQIPTLQKLPRYCLNPAAPSNYRIRKEPTESALSTVEATVEALRTLEPETKGFDKLLRAFDGMIDEHLLHSEKSGRLRIPKRPWKPPANIPAVLIDDLPNVVVAYGEAARGLNGQRQKNREPIYWTAQRLGTGETFELAIRPRRPVEAEFLTHLELSAADFANAVAPADFRDAWQKFLRPTDTLAVFNDSTLRLLTTIDAEVPSSVTLKSVNLRQDCKTLDALVSMLELIPPRVAHKGRAGKRLASAIAYVKHLHNLGNGP